MKVHIGPLLSSLLVAGVMIAALRPEPDLGSLAGNNATRQDLSAPASSRPESGLLHGRNATNSLLIGESTDATYAGFQRVPSSTLMPEQQLSFVGELERPQLSEGTELHLIGVYEGAPAPGASTAPWWKNCKDEFADHVKCHARFAMQHEQRIVDVDVAEMKRPVILALTSYEPTLWRIHASNPAQIARVILGGNHAQAVNGLATDTPVEIYTVQPSDCANCMQGEGSFFTYKRGENSRGFAKAVKKLWSITGLRPVTFQGRYSGTRFAVSERLPRLSYPDRTVPGSKPKRQS